MKREKGECKNWLEDERFQVSRCWEEQARLLN
jgi:hypothetical protein